jgi:hypothetical protein
MMNQQAKDHAENSGYVNGPFPCGSVNKAIADAQDPGRKNSGRGITD